MNEISMSSVSGLFQHLYATELEELEIHQPSISIGMQASNVRNAILHFYDKGLYTDVEFQVQCGDGFISYGGHKLIMSLMSPVFADMFFGKHSTPGFQTIEINDVLPSAFETLIQYIYGFKVDTKKNRGDANFLLKIYKAAKKYEVESLKVLCCEMFSSVVPTMYNVFELLDAAVLTESDCLKLRCYKILQTQTQEILASRDLATITPAIINTMLDMPSLSLHSEYELLEWIFAWGSLKFDKNTFRINMEPFLNRLNFTTLSPFQFGQLVNKYDELFDESEAFRFFMHIVCPEFSKPLPSWCNSSPNQSRSYKPRNDEDSMEFNDAVSLT